MSEILTVSVPAPSGFAEADAVRRAAFDRAVQSGETGVCLVLAQTPGADEPVGVVVNVAAETASAVLPLPLLEADLGWACRFDFPCGTFLISDRPCEETLQRALSALPEPERLFAVSLDQETANLESLLHDRKSGETRPVRRTSEGAASAALYLHRDLENGTMEVTVGQPGGVLEIGMRKGEGRVLGLSVGGPVREV